MSQYGNQSLIVTQKWKDSLTFILNGNFQPSKFNLDIQFGEKSSGWPSLTFKTVDQIIIVHKAPFLEAPKNREFVFRENIYWDCKGIYFNGLNQGYLIKSLDGTVNLSYPGSYSSNAYYTVNLVPGDYSLQLYSSDRLSNLDFFTVKAPIIETVSPTLFNRDNTIQITGKNLPLYSDYLFTHIQSGRTFTRKNDDKSTNTLQDLNPEGIVGDGTYQLEFKIGDMSFKYPGTLEFKDNMHYLMKIIDPIKSITSLGAGFASNGKLYILQREEMGIIDLRTGKIQTKSGYYFYGQPFFFNSKIYMKINIGNKTSMYIFNEVNED